MNSIVLAVLLTVVAVTVQARQVQPANKIKWLCEPCHWCFDEVEKLLPEIDLITEELLMDAVNVVCAKVPFIDHVCVKLGDDIVHDLYQFILTLDHFDVNSVCQHLDMC